MAKTKAPAGEQSWYADAADRMVREGKSLPQVLSELMVSTTTEEAQAIFKTRKFQTLLWTARHKYHQELAQNPERTKQAALGQMVICIQGLMEKGEWDKAVEAILKLAKVEGWVGAETSVNVFQELKGEQFEELKRRALERLKASPQADA